MDSGEHGLPRLSFSLVWDSSDKIQGDSNCRSSLVFFPSWKRVRSPAVFGPNLPADRSENNSLVGLSAVALAETSSLFVSARNHKEDRQFESPPLQQRGTANRRSDPSMTLRRYRAIGPPHMRRAHSHLYWTGVGRAVPRVPFLLPISVKGGRLVGRDFTPIV